uniref:Rho GTPase-activating protein 12-like n=1 Tax=Sinocyclocheilus anshuiensis TaxID=1608454 RepID=A0A671TFV4_9TELE
MADRSVAPGQMYIEVEYDYEYKSKDRVIIIKQGESYLLVKKTNEDWWQVRKDEVSKAFYVPAQYVREVRRALMPPPKPLSAAGRGGTGPIRPSGLEIQRPDESKKSLCPSPSGNALLTPNDDRGSPGSPTAHVPPTQMNTLPGSLPRSRAKSPSRNVDGEKDKDKELEKSSRGPEKGAIHEEFAREGGGLDKNRNDSESGDDLSSGSTDNLQVRTTCSGQGRPDSPVYINLQELKIFQSSIPPLPSSSPFHTNGDWETHKDQNGRHFYYNCSTQERTWKPPRARDSLTRKEEKQDMTDTESNHSPLLPGDAHKTRSLDRRLPDFIPMRPRHSVYLHESNDKSSEKCGNLNMTKITEHGKKVRKNWTSYWTVLQGSSLLFNKGQGGGTGWFGREQKLEFSVELKGGSVDWASKDKSSKKHVLELKTRQGMELLLQSDNDSLISEWHKALTEAIHTYVRSQKVQAVKDLMKQLPRPNHDTIQALFKHLKKVIQHVDENRMTTQSVAIVFGPTLLRPEVETANMAIHMVYQNQIVELILMEYEKIFGR